MRLTLVLLFLILAGCTGDKDRFAEFEAEYTPAMQELTSLVKDTRHDIKDSEAAELSERCNTVGEEIHKRALVLQEKANALKDEEARKASAIVANGVKDSANAVGRLGASYVLLLQGGRGQEIPGYGRYGHIFDHFVKEADLKKLVEKVETEHAALKGVMARK